MNHALLINQTTTTAMYCNNFASLEVNIEIVNSNIELFKMHMMGNQEALKNRVHYIDEDDMLHP